VQEHDYPSAGEDHALLAVLRHPPAGSKVQAAAVRRLAAFARHQARMPGTASQVLARYLFDTPYAAARDLLAAQQLESCAALAALLAGARAYDRLPPDQRMPSFPQHLALLLSAGEGLPGEPVESSAGVHVLTVHAAKGQEWPVVFVPQLAKHRFPGHRRTGEPIAAGVLDTDSTAAREQDDRCLFFVAISRARDRLVLSRAQRYGGRNAEPSPLLTLLESGFAAEPPVRLTWESRPALTGSARVATASSGEAPGASPRAPTDSAPPNGETAPPTRATQPPRAATPPPDIDLHDLETYRACPRRYAYEHMPGLEGAAWSARHFHIAIRRALGNLQREARYSAADAEAALQEAWSAPHEPLPHESLYVTRAKRAIIGAARRQAERVATGETHTEHDLTFRLDRPSGTIRLRLDRIDRTPDAPPVATIYRTGKQSDDHRRDLRTAVAHAALQTIHSGGTVRQEYVLTGATDDKIGRTKTLADRLAEADLALQGIAAGHFAPKPTRACPSCPFWLLCTGMGDHDSGEE
jgi:DNA helicase-2/ATP-dependent DNA helicase PcrA